LCLNNPMLNPPLLLNRNKMLKLKNLQMINKISKIDDGQV